MWGFIISAPRVYLSRSSRELARRNFLSASTAGLAAAGTSSSSMA
ncbi:MAG: twin-arginine translocation signal domain-containing protein [Verrucomicrobia bacterium]|nr:twin-arginine translocation signal domain-containing protein [Verrucomicrobiota bacterium]